MPSQTGFRGLNAAQREIITHWHNVRGPHGLPRKSDIDPGTLRAHLASISMVEVDPSGRARFRIVGTRLREILGGEMRGRWLSELEPEKAEMWTLGLTSALERGVPVGGILARTHDHHAWLRLPLDTGLGISRIVLCHDVIIGHEASEPDAESSLFSTLRGSLAA